MQSLAPLLTGLQGPPVAVPGQPTFTLSQSLVSGQTTAIFSLSGIGLSGVPSNIVPQITQLEGPQSIPCSMSTPWTASSAVVNLTIPAPDKSYTCILQIYP